MVSITIKDPGLFITIPKYGSFRTPAVINIHEDFIKYVEALLRQTGINNYVIGKEKKGKKEKKEEEFIVTTIDITPKVEDMEAIKNKLINIEELLRILLKKKNVDISEETSVEKVRRKRRDEKEDDVFIPKINDSSFILKGDSSRKSRTGEEEISGQVDALLKLRNKE